MRPPSYKEINGLILLGIVAMLCSLFLVLNDVKQSGYWVKYYPVSQLRDSVRTPIDTFWVTHQNQIVADTVDQATRGISRQAGEIEYPSLLFHYNPTFLVWIVFFCLTFSVSLV